MSVTLYSKDDCVQCNATKRALTARGIKYNEFNVETDPAALEKAKAFGFLQAPVVVVDFTHENTEEQVWSGYRPDLIAKL